MPVYLSEAARRFEEEHPGRTVTDLVVVYSVNVNPGRAVRQLERFLGEGSFGGCRDYDRSSRSSCLDDREE